MQEHNWLLSVVSDLRAYSEDRNVPDIMVGLKHVLATYVEEASLSSDEAEELLTRLETSSQKVS